MIISQTPLRISFAGGGTDLKDYYRQHDGWVISSAIDKYVFVIINDRFDDDIYVNYSQKERVARPEEIRHDLVREALKKTGIEKGVEITTLADIPSEGSGLGSSSSVTVGLLNALYAYKGVTADAERLAREAAEIEIDILGKPIGKQDQYIAAYGGLRFFEFCKDGSVRANKIDLDNGEKRAFGANLLLFYTGLTRKADDILHTQKKQYTAKADVLTKMKYQAAAIRELITIRQFDRVGEILHEAWEYKKSLVNAISIPEIDRMYQIARKAGALGGKICGAGGGGFLLLYCPRERQNELRRALKGYREFPFFLEKSGSKIIFNYERYEWK
jgi:D-glycero-alpha-D-manno-heptose-7-phosphate kinase